MRKRTVRTVVGWARSITPARPTCRLPLITSCKHDNGDIDIRIESGTDEVTVVLSPELARTLGALLIERSGRSGR